MFKLVTWFDQQSVKGRVIFVCGTIIAFLLFILLIGFTVGQFISVIRSDGAEFSNWYWGFVSPLGKPVTIAVSGIVLMILFSSVHKTYKNRIKTTDERGIHYLEESTYGSSRWLSENEIERSFKLDDINHTIDTVYGQLTDDGSKVVSFKPNAKGGEGNRNVLMIATMGSGKSFGYVRTELLQAVIRGNSFVVTDPSAELYTDLSKFLREYGVDVKVLNLSDPTHSDFWNMLDEVIDPETERIDAMRLNSFASVFIKNSAPTSVRGASEDPFFVPSAENLLKAVIGYTAWRKESPIIHNYASLYKKITGLQSDPFIEALEGSIDPSKGIVKEAKHIGFPECRKTILRAAKESGYDIHEVKELLRDIEKYSPEQELNITNVYNNLKYHMGEGPYDIPASMKDVPYSNPAKAPWVTFDSSAKADVKAQILQGLQLRMNLFDSDTLRETLSHDGIKIADVNKKQSAYFVIVPDKIGSPTKPVSSLFFTFLFQDAQENWDAAMAIAKEGGTPNPCYDLVAMLDEFYSIGIIGGDVDAFGTIMSNSRKRHFYISIILQTYSQLEALYGPSVKDILQAGCSTLLYLGGNDPNTCEFISKWSGEATVLSEIHTQLGGSVNRTINTDTTMRQDQRPVLTIKEAQMWKNKVLVLKQGELPLSLKPFPWIQHPAYKLGYVTPESIATNIVPLKEKLSILEAEREANQKEPARLIQEFAVNNGIYFNETNASEEETSAVSMPEDDGEIVFDTETGEVVLDRRQDKEITEEKPIKEVREEKPVNSSKPKKSIVADDFMV